jgi:pimeloyl-ACP methyl ester carboxylesterase
MEGVGGNLLSDASLNSLSQALESYSQDLTARGVDISHYTMVDVVSDLEAARKAFRYEKIDLLSLSYGTRVALIYSYLHPAVVFRSVMIGVNPPGHFTWSPTKIDEQLNYYDRLFAADSSRYDGRPLSQSIRTALAKMPSRWSLFKLDPGKIRVITFAMLYHKQSAALVFDCYRAAEQGDYSGLYILQRAYDFMMPSMMTWGDLFAKGSTDFDPDIDYLSSMRDSTTIMGSPFSLLIVGSAAGHWPIHRLPPELNRIQQSDVQTLLISGSIDFSDPAEYATEELLPSLTNGKQVILREMGHVGDVITLQRSALEHLLLRFYDEGVVDDSKFKYDPMDFDPPINLPLWTKVLYPFILILSLF